MSLDIGPMPAATSQIALLASPHMAMPSEVFASLMDIDPHSSKAVKPVENADNALTLETLDVLRPSKISETPPDEAGPAIAQAHALVFALSPVGISPRVLGKSPEVLAALPTEDEPAPAPVISSAATPIALPITTRKPAYQPLAHATREPERELTATSSKDLEDTSVDQSESDDRRDETIEVGPVAREISAEPNAFITSTMQVSQSPVPVTESAVALDEATLEIPKSPDRANATQKAVPMAMSESDNLPKYLEVANKNPDSFAAHIEEQISEIQLQSPSTAKHAAIVSKPANDRALVSEAASTIIPTSEIRLTRGLAANIVSSHKPEVSETLTTTANIVQDSVAIPTIKSVSDLPTTASALSAIVNAPVSNIDTILDRQLDLVRNERWLGELAQDIASTSDSKDRLSFRLMPHQLGRLDIDVSRSHSGISLTIRTESDSAQSILTAAHPRLADELRAQGVRLADTQMFSSDARHSQHHGGAARPVSLIENFITPTDAPDAPEQVQRDGRYA